MLMLGVHGGGGGSRNRTGAGHHGGHGFLDCRIGARVHAARGADRMALVMVAIASQGLPTGARDRVRRSGLQQD